MLIIQSKLIDFKTKECVGLICVNKDTSVALSLNKAKELGIEDIDLIEYLDVTEEEVAINPRRPEFYALVSSAVGVLDDYSEIPYEKMGSLINLLDCKEVIWGTVFKCTSFIELDNEIAYKRAISNSESGGES